MPRIVYLSLLILGSLASCDNSKPDENQNPEEKEMKRRISSISVESSRTSDLFEYSYPSEKVMEVQAKMGSVQTSIRYEFNDENQLIEWISGNDHIKFQYGPKSTRIGSVSSRGLHMRFEYDQQYRLVRETQMMGSTVNRVTEYKYGGGSMPEVVVTTSSDIVKTYQLTYFDQENPFTNTCEFVYPYDLLYWLGYGALYGDKILKSAVLVGDFEMYARNQEPRRDPIHLFNDSPEFELEKSDKSLVIKRKSDNSIHWSARVKYGLFDL